MSDTSEVKVKPVADEGTLTSARPAVKRGGRPILGRIVRSLSFRNISAVYVFAVTFAIFSLWVPDTFLSANTWRALITSQAVTAMLAVGLVVALSAGAFDLSFGSTLGFGAILVAWLLVKAGVPVIAAVALSILAGALIGLVNGLLVVKARIDSFIATLGMSSVLLALISWVSSSQQILGLSGSFQKLGTSRIFGLGLPVYLMLGVSTVIWYVLECTPVGRHVYATGGNAEAARLAGVRTSTVIVLALVCCGAVAAFSGLLVSSSLGVGDPTIGPAYMLPAFSAAFLGSTQLRGGRFNVWGTVMAVYVLATGVKGLQLAGAPIWIPDLFNGIALLLAVGLAKYQGTAHRAGAVKRLLRFDRKRNLSGARSR
ncbi:ABC transporter permease [Actinoallomurus sp. CA-150999]|uniref:ABC transporter permease n=1 Tax=Actinoallomurus sp. CA-150999 TaxID=3239887 RepID=UPI003D8E14AB